MDYQDDNGDWIGFDADMAKAFAESLGVEVEFVSINLEEPYKKEILEYMFDEIRKRVLQKENEK